MTKKLILICFAIFMAASCSGPTMEYSLSDKYRNERPYTLAVLPVRWASNPPEKQKAIEHFRAMSSDKLLTLGYRLVPLETVDAAYPKGKTSAMTEKSNIELAEKLGADGLVLIQVVNWDIVHLGNYASLNIETVFSIYSKKGGLIWSANYKTSESDMSFDPEPVDIAVVKVYEPRILRLVDSMFATLPQAERPASEKTFFDWLP